MSDKDWTWLQKLRRAQKDRRIDLGIWSRYQLRENEEVNFYADFDIKWVFLRHGHLYFPKHMEFNQWQLLEIGERRALFCKHPNRFTKKPIRLCEASLAWNGWKVFKRLDRETGYVSYAVYYRDSTCGKHCIKVELDLDKFNYNGNPMMLPDLPESMEHPLNKREAE